MLISLRTPKQVRATVIEDYPEVVTILLVSTSYDRTLFWKTLSAKDFTMYQEQGQTAPYLIPVEDLTKWAKRWIPENSRSTIKFDEEKENWGPEATRLLTTLLETKAPGLAVYMGSKSGVEWNMSSVVRMTTRDQRGAYTHIVDPYRYLQSLFVAGSFEEGVSRRAADNSRPLTHPDELSPTSRNYMERNESTRRLLQMTQERNTAILKMNKLSETVQVLAGHNMELNRTLRAAEEPQETSWRWIKVRIGDDCNADLSKTVVKTEPQASNLEKILIDDQVATGADSDIEIVEEVNLVTPKKKKRKNPTPRLSAPDGRFFVPVTSNPRVGGQSVLKTPTDAAKKLAADWNKRMGAFKETGARPKEPTASVTPTPTPVVTPQSPASTVVAPIQVQDAMAMIVTSPDPTETKSTVNDAYGFVRSEKLLRCAAMKTYVDDSCVNVMDNLAETTEMLGKLTHKVLEEVSDGNLSSDMEGVSIDKDFEKTLAEVQKVTIGDEEQDGNVTIEEDLQPLVIDESNDQIMDESDVKMEEDCSLLDEPDEETESTAEEDVNKEEGKGWTPVSSDTSGASVIVEYERSIKSEDSSNNSLNSSILDATANSSEYSTVTEVNKNIERVNNNYYEFTDLIGFRMRHEESSYLETYFNLYRLLVRNVIIIIFKVIGQQVTSLEAGCCASRSNQQQDFQGLKPTA